MALKFNYNDGGRSNYFKATKVGDCGVRALAIASGHDYKECYDLIRKISGSTPRNGIKREHFHKAAQQLGAVWTPLMTIGSGCTAHLREGEVPMGKVVCNVSGHFVAVIDGVINDTYDCSREGTRCVYGYWLFREKHDRQETKIHYNGYCHTIICFELLHGDKTVGYTVYDHFYDGDKQYTHFFEYQNWANATIKTKRLIDNAKESFYNK